MLMNEMGKHLVKSLIIDIGIFFKRSSLLQRQQVILTEY